jgi:hypothetical protein
MRRGDRPPACYSAECPARARSASETSARSGISASGSIRDVPGARTPCSPSRRTCASARATKSCWSLLTSIARKALAGREASVETGSAPEGFELASRSVDPPRASPLP